MFRSTSPNTRPPSTTFTHTREKHGVSTSRTTMTTDKPPVTTMTTNKPLVTTPLTDKPPVPKPPTDNPPVTEPTIPVTTERPTTSPLNKSSESGKFSVC